MLNRVESGEKRTGNRKKPYIGTFHSLGARILRRECKLLGREPNFAIFDDHDSFEIVKKAVKDILGGRKAEDETEKQKKDPKKSPAFFAQKISEKKNFDGRLLRRRPSNDPLDARLDGRDDKEGALIEKIFTAYETALAKNNAFDFAIIVFSRPYSGFKITFKICR